MLKTRIIPTLLWKGFTLVKDKQFRSERRINNIIPTIKVFDSREVDELIIVDILATQENRSPDIQNIKDFSKECFMPLTIGGGIKSLKDISQLLNNGADKVSINSSAYINPQLINNAVKTFGSQCIVVSIDVKKEKGEYWCYSHSGKKNTGKTILEWISIISYAGVGEILLTSIDHDGMMQGYDLKLISLVSKIIKIPIIAQGGCGSYEDMYKALIKGANAVSASSIFEFTEQTPLEAKKYLKKKGLSVRR